MSRPTSAPAGSPGTASPTTAARAAELLGPDGLGLWDAERRSRPTRRAAELLAALSRAADPDLALRQLHRLVECGRGGDRRRRRRIAERARRPATSDPGLRRRLVAVLGASSALGDHLVANPGQLAGAGHRPDGLPPTAEGRAGAGRRPRTRCAALRPAYRLALLRIAAADLTGGRGLEPTMAALSALADATLAAAYDDRGGRAPAGTDRPAARRSSRWASAAAAS